MTFRGFTSTGLELLSALPHHDQAAFKAASDIYRNELLEPAKAFVAELGPAIRDAVSPGIESEAKVNGSIAPIHNDLRFWPDGPRYRDSLLFRFWEGPTRRHSPTLTVRVRHDRVEFGTAFAPDADRLCRYREAVDGHGDLLAGEIGKLVRYRSAEIAGNRLARVPQPFESEHAHAELLRHTTLSVRFRVDAGTAISKAGFVTFSRKHLERLGAVHRWVVDRVM